MVGSALTPVLLQQGHTVCILTRDQRESSIPGLRYQRWDVHDETIDAATIAKADAIVHLAGANVGEKRWTHKRKQEILQSRVQTGELISRSLQKLPHHISVVISASGMGWYGPLTDDKKEKGFTETDPSSPDFLGEVCRQWEGALEGVKSTSARLVIYRFGLILSNQGGVFPAFLKPIRFGMAPIPGNGKQFMSWIHIKDAVRLILLALENKNISGVYNGAAPGVVSSDELIRTIGKASGKKTSHPACTGAFIKTRTGGDECGAIEVG